MRSPIPLLIDFLISLLCALLLPAIFIVWLRWRAHERDVLGAAWERGTDCAEEDVPVIVTTTESGSTVTWTWKTK